MNTSSKVAFAIIVIIMIAIVALAANISCAFGKAEYDEPECISPWWTIWTMPNNPTCNGGTKITQLCEIMVWSDWNNDWIKTAKARYFCEDSQGNRVTLTQTYLPLIINIEGGIIGEPICNPPDLCKPNIEH